MKPTESCQELFQRIDIIFHCWTKEATTKQAIMELVCIEKGLLLLPYKVQIWVRNQPPTTPTEAGSDWEMTFCTTNPR